VLDHATRDNVGGLLSVLGGKLAAYRIQSEEAVDLAVQKLGRPPAASVTGERPLPGAAPQPDFLALSEQLGLPAWALERVWRRLGDRVHRVFADATASSRSPVCRSEAVTVAEIAYAVTVEGCRTLEDLRRHTHIAGGGCDGVDCVTASAHQMAELLEWSPARTNREIEQFSNERWVGRRPVLRGITLAQEEVWRGVHDFGVSG
jgi:glycerol-3-phosphate dehydrogenase